MTLRIVPADLDDPRVVALLTLHATSARAETAEGCAHALDVDALRTPKIAVWAAWEDETLVGVGALKRLSPEHGELKSMHTAQAARGRGVGAAVLSLLIAEARSAGMRRLSLETGSWAYFEAARGLYRRHGFSGSPPFGDYGAGPNSVFLTLDLTAST